MTMTGHLAGSHLTLDSACRNLMAHTGYGLCHAIRMASLNPAKLLGLERELGSIAPGKKANLLLIDDLVHVKKVFLAGRRGLRTAAVRRTLLYEANDPRRGTPPRRFQRLPQPPR